MSTTTTQQQPDPKALAKARITQLKGIMAAPSVMEQFNNVLKENAGAFVASIIDLYNSETTLQECNPNSVVFEALKAASLKLPVNKSLGFAYIVAYKGVPTMQIGYKGYIQLAYRTGQYSIINADVVYEGEYRGKKKLTGEFDLEGEAKSDTVIGFFAHFELKYGLKKTLYMTVDQVHAWAKKYSPSYRGNNKIWRDEFDKMAIKTVLRNLLVHWGYMSVEMAEAISGDSDYVNPNEAVKDEIRENANSQRFEDAVIVDDKQQAPDPNAGMQPNQGFNNPQDDGPGY
ncbi:recombinase RecT [Desertivirga xinjiangensis]|uniref:recombinase RecT n=1 Tax=Desertivirga xinjiangensis TaxID=539206 RepID=UPI00210DF2C9|nr:recombinase RecT [Pedobacter xinjiangensis]